MKVLVTLVMGLAAGGLVVFLIWPVIFPKSELADEFTQDQAWFADVTEAVGPEFTHDAGPVGSYFMPQIIGSGGALFDFNNDGLLGIYLLQNGGPQSTARNR